jgi:16S rRNA (cytosine1402-N4)-methyltransferase
MNDNKLEHIPVLLNESVEGLAIKKDGIYIDATFGRGGHSRAILECLGPSGKLIVIDQDPTAIMQAQKLQQEFAQIIIFQKNYSEIYSICQELDIVEKVSGILIDCGVSSPQLDNAERGFSFSKPGPIDMRMNTDSGMTAHEWLNKVKEKDLADTLYKFADERYSRRIAKAIVQARAENKFNDTAELAEIIKVAHPKWPKDTHPATKSFQAIRIFINKELSSLATALEASLKVLMPQGRLCVISFHSLEDRMVKQFVNKYSKVAPEAADLPIKDAANDNMRFKSIHKLIKASAQEIADNPRSRSSRLRVIEKIF